MDRLVHLVGELRAKKIVRQKQIEEQNFYLDELIWGNLVPQEN